MTKRSTGDSRKSILVTILLSACSAEPLTPPGDVDLAPGGHSFADTLFAVERDGQITQCNGGSPSCLVLPETSCDAKLALGTNDGQRWDLGANGTLEVAFLCGFIMEHGGDAVTPDFKIWATVTDGSRAIVEVGPDPSHYQRLDFLDESDKSFALERVPGAEIVRYVRITDAGQGGVSIDAIEAL